jgi:predicted nucleic acid-binding protein
VKAFFDCNVAVYAFADDDDRRKSVAMDLLARHGGDCELVVSTQVLLETYNVLVRKKGLLPDKALAYVRMLTTYEVVTPGAAAALAALTLATEHGLPTYDAFIVQAALEGGCDVLFSEDLQAGRRFGNLLVVNPFDTAAHEPSPPYAAPAAARKRKGPVRKA